MNYSKTTRDSHNTTSHTVNLTQAILFATVQIVRPNEQGLAYTSEAIKNSLRSVSDYGVDTKQIANKVSIALRSNEVAGQSGFIVVVYVGRDVIEVSMAGPHRVHLVAPDGALIDSVREHILAYDSEAAAAFAPHRRYNDEWIVTRSIGVWPTTLGPETTHWAHQGSCAVVICSTELHRDRPPVTYLPILLAPPETWGALEGSATVIRRQAPG